MICNVQVVVTRKLHILDRRLCCKVGGRCCGRLQLIETGWWGRGLRGMVVTGGGGVGWAANIELQDI
jgi:hypothetical protein